MAGHRARVMRLIEDARGRSGRSLCLLGAGNANDVELARLALDFERVVLVDLDEEALSAAVERLTPAEGRRVECRGADLTGLLGALGSWQAGNALPDAEITSAIQLARRARAPAIGRFDVVASTCVLSQLIDSVYMGVAPQDVRSLELVMAVRNRHLEMLVELLEPGGAGVLVTDFVSTETAPELAEMDESLLPQAAWHYLEQRNFFTGANPLAIRDYYERLAAIDARIGDVQVAAPWRWDIGAKQFAVAAVTFRRGR